MQRTFWTPELQSAALAFLEENYATSMFLLGNFENVGARLGSEPNSGNFQILLDGASVAGVFVITLRGNLLLSGSPSPEAVALICEGCASEEIPVKGVLGTWELAKAVWDEMGKRGTVQSCSFHSREILYRLNSIPTQPKDPDVRFLEESDYAEWSPARHAYQTEEGIQHVLPEEQQRANFLKFSAMREYWGIFEGRRMLSTAALNARALDIGQVGGVFTWPEYRKRGLSKRVMRQLLTDCAELHGLKRMILFTGERNFAAQRVYETLGFTRIGHFGIFFV